jgi:tRNA (guanosine-2'-O-)-methyltransferase
MDGLKAEGLAIYAGVPGPDSVPLWDLDCTRPCALVFGNEHRGVSPVVRACADRLFAIPMRGFAESFNLSVAAGMSLYHAVRQREAAGRPSDLDEAERDALLSRYELRSVAQYQKLVEVLPRTGAPAESPRPADVQAEE